MKYTKQKKVQFNNNPQIKTFKIKAKYNFVKDRRIVQQENRQLRRIERHMRSINLLNEGEFLELQNEEVKHIRGDYINFISHKETWIPENQYLKIIS